MPMTPFGRGSHRRGLAAPPLPSCAALRAALCGTLLVACTNNVRVGGSAGGVAMRTGNTGWLTKKVVSKKPPEALMAEDGTVCRVSPERFRDTAVGTLLPCDWQ